MEVVVVVVVGGWGGVVLTAFCSFIATSAHYEEDNELGNFGRGMGGWGPFSLKTSSILNREGVGGVGEEGRGGEGGDPIQKLILPGVASNAGTALYVGRIIGSSMSPSVCR